MTEQVLEQEDVLDLVHEEDQGHEQDDEQDHELGVDIERGLEDVHVLDLGHEDVQCLAQEHVQDLDKYRDKIVDKYKDTYMCMYKILPKTMHLYEQGQKETKLTLDWTMYKFLSTFLNIFRVGTYEDKTAFMNWFQCLVSFNLNFEDMYKTMTVFMDMDEGMHSFVDFYKSSIIINTYEEEGLVTANVKHMNMHYTATLDMILDKDTTEDRFLLLITHLIMHNSFVTRVHDNGFVCVQMSAGSGDTMVLDKGKDMDETKNVPLNLYSIKTKTKNKDMAGFMNKGIDMFSLSNNNVWASDLDVITNLSDLFSYSFTRWSLATYFKWASARSCFLDLSANPPFCQFEDMNMIVKLVMAILMFMNQTENRVNDVKKIITKLKFMTKVGYRIPYVNPFRNETMRMNAGGAKNVGVKRYMSKFRFKFMIKKVNKNKYVYETTKMILLKLSFIINSQMLMYMNRFETYHMNMYKNNGMLMLPIDGLIATVVSNRTRDFVTCMNYDTTLPISWYLNLYTSMVTLMQMDKCQYILNITDNLSSLDKAFVSDFVEFIDKDSIPAKISNESAQVVLIMYPDWYEPLIIPMYFIKQLNVFTTTHMDKNMKVALVTNMHNYEHTIEKTFMGEFKNWNKYVLKIKDLVKNPDMVDVLLNYEFKTEEVYNIWNECKYLFMDLDKYTDGFRAKAKIKN
jgi:hypothetical protein